MIYSIDHSINASFMLWMDNILLEQGRAFDNMTGALVKVPSDISGHNVYMSYQSQWIYDSSVSGANIPSGVIANGSFVPSGVSLYFDFQRGRVVSDVNYSTVSANYAAKEINLYQTTENEETLVFANKFLLHSKTSTSAPVLKGNEKYYPAIYLKYDAGKNVPQDFNGIKETLPKIRATVLVDSSFLLDGVCGLLRDTKETSFALLSPSQFPFNASGNLKKGSFNYKNEVAVSQQDPNNVVFIKDVAISPFRTSVNEMIGKNILGAFIDFDLSICRYVKN